MISVLKDVTVQYSFKFSTLSYFLNSDLFNLLSVMWHSPLADWKHALVKQCGLDLVFPCIIVKMFVSAIVSLLLLGTAALPCLLIVESWVLPFPYQFTSREMEAGPSSGRFVSTHCSVPAFLPPRRKQKSQHSKSSSKVNLANRNVVWLPPLAVLLTPDQGLTEGRNAPLRCSSLAARFCQPWHPLSEN